MTTETDSNGAPRPSLASRATTTSRAAQTESAHDILREFVRARSYALTAGITNDTVKQVRAVGG
jgi:hypothetical protein